jgi:hypothetical protein
MPELYNCFTVPGGLRMTKFDEDFNVLSSYIIFDDGTCECPRGSKHTCRHRQMLPLFRKEQNIDKAVFLEWETRLWRIPTKAMLDQMGLQAPTAPGTLGDSDSNGGSDAPLGSHPGEAGAAGDTALPSDPPPEPLTQPAVGEQPQPPANVPPAPSDIAPQPTPASVTEAGAPLKLRRPKL